MSVFCPPEVLGWAIPHGKSQQVRWQGRERVSVGHYTSSSFRYSQNYLSPLNTEGEQGLDWKRKLMVLKNYSCWSCMTKKIWQNHSHTPIFQCCFWQQQHCSLWQPSAPVPADSPTTHRGNEEHYYCLVSNSQRTT